MTFGTGIGLLRTLSAVAAAVTVVALAALLRRWDGPVVAVIAAVLLAGMSGFDRYAQELRPYAFLAMTSCLSWMAWDWWCRTRRPLACTPMNPATPSRASVATNDHPVRPWLAAISDMNV